MADRSTRLQDSLGVIQTLSDLKASPAEVSAAAGIGVQVGGDGLESAARVGTVSASNLAEQLDIAETKVTDDALKKRAQESAIKLNEELNAATGIYARKCAAIA